MRNQLISDYPDITPTVVTMALQSVFYEEERARQVLANMAETERKTQETLASTTPQMSRYLFCMLMPLLKKKCEYLNLVTLNKNKL